MIELKMHNTFAELNDISEDLYSKLRKILSYEIQGAYFAMQKRPGWDGREYLLKKKVYQYAFVDTTDDGPIYVSDLMEGYANFKIKQLAAQRDKAIEALQRIKDMESICDPKYSAIERRIIRSGIFAAHEAGGTCF